MCNELLWNDVMSVYSVNANIDQFKSREQYLYLIFPRFI